MPKSSTSTQCFHKKRVVVEQLLQITTISIPNAMVIPCLLLSVKRENIHGNLLVKNFKCISLWWCAAAAYQQLLYLPFSNREGIFKVVRRMTVPELLNFSGRTLQQITQGPSAYRSNVERDSFFFSNTNLLKTFCTPAQSLINRPFGSGINVFTVTHGNMMQSARLHPREAYFILFR